MSSDDTICKELFDCKMCGTCCQGFGGTVVTDTDIRLIADYCKIPEADLRRDYLQSSGSRKVLAQKEDGYCVFFNNLCTIHPVKPRMCRQWPFIKNVLKDVTNWRIMAGSCPGIRPEAEEDKIRACVSRELEQNDKREE